MSTWTTPIFTLRACSTARKYGKDQCPRYSIPARELEEFVLDRVRRYFVEVCPKEALKSGLERIFSEREKSLEEVESIRREVDAFNKRKNMVFQQIVASGKIELFQKTLEALRALGVEVIVNPDKKEGGIEVNPFVCSATA